MVKEVKMHLHTLAQIPIPHLHSYMYMYALTFHGQVYYNASVSCSRMDCS